MLDLNISRMQNDWQTNQDVIHSYETIFAKIINFDDAEQIYP